VIPAERDRRFRSIVTERFGIVTGVRPVGVARVGIVTAAIDLRSWCAPWTGWAMAGGFSVAGSVRGGCVAIFGGRFLGVRAGRGFSERFAGKLDAVYLLQDAIEDGIGDGGIPDPAMPVVNREL
jgi:hypothetical protein